jgi:hypothetical protein
MLRRLAQDGLRESDDTGEFIRFLPAEFRSQKPSAGDSNRDPDTAAARDVIAGELKTRVAGIAGSCLRETARAVEFRDSRRHGRARRLLGDPISSRLSMVPPIVAGTELANHSPSAGTCAPGADKATNQQEIRWRIRS